MQGRTKSAGKIDGKDDRAGRGIVVVSNRLRTAVSMGIPLPSPPKMTIIISSLAHLCSLFSMSIRFFIFIFVSTSRSLAGSTS